eukprot:2578902-Amphidinium_carterae.1
MGSTNNLVNVLWPHNMKHRLRSLQALQLAKGESEHVLEASNGGFWRHVKTWEQSVAVRMVGDAIVA